jgi:hypothetical protein
MTNASEQVAQYAERVLPLHSASLGDEYYYQSLPLCVIDAVYSTGVRYARAERCGAERDRAVLELDRSARRAGGG